MLDAIRSFFDGRGFLEVETPIAVPSPGMETHLLAFESSFTKAGKTGEPLYLHTSPEYAMKRLLAREVGHIYQIARVFRDEPLSRTHTPEFSLLEWYRSPGQLAEIMDELEALISLIAQAVDGPWKPRGFERLSVSEAFTRADLVDPLECPDPDAFRAALPVRCHDDDDWDDMFHRAMFEKVEPRFSREKPTILFGYPARMAALSKIDPEDERKCLRFELYAGSLELANAFQELTDPNEQRARFMIDQETRSGLGLPIYPVDEALLSELGKIQTASGIALGVDRLLMLCLNAENIEAVVPFAPREM